MSDSLSADQPANAIKARFLSALRDHGDQFHPSLGRAGYAIPDISDYQWHRLKGGSENWALVSIEGTRWLDYRFDFGDKCCNNIIVFGPNCTCIGRFYVRGSNNVAVLLGAPAGIQPVNVHFHSDGHLFYFGEGCTSNTVTFEMGGSKSSIMVGQDCMFSADIQVMTSDEHSLIDLTDGTFLNPSASIQFDPHVWVGFRSAVLKGAHVGFGSVVAAYAVVTRDVKAKTVVAGNPARLVRENVGWVRPKSPPPDALDYLTKLELKSSIGPE